VIVVMVSVVWEMPTSHQRGRQSFCEGLTNAADSQVFPKMAIGSF
jgi:hypothetical protein